MYLKRIDIKGFKTFADSTEVILQPGINVIVGPNGCGKSNIVDAVRWCLGESNVRNLRGQRGEDVIFNGTDEKRAQGMALVELLIDNGDQVLPLDYQEITIARKLFRSGESEFSINKARVRLKDIYGMFAGTGLGRKGYSIISQGELEQVLNGQPLDRRFILEEASGIIKYRQQRDEVKNRLAATGQDLTRLKDILAELGQRRDELQVKSDKASRHMVLRDEKQKMEENILRFEIDKMQQDLLKKNQALMDKKQETAEIRGRVQKEEETIASEESRLHELREGIISLKDEKHDSDSRLSGLEGEVRLCQERIRNCQERVATAAEDEKKYRLMLQKMQGELQSRVEDYEIRRLSLIDLTTSMEKLDRQLEELDSSVQQNQKSFEANKQRVFERMQEASRINNQLTEIESRQRKAEEKRERLDILRSELKKKISRQEELLHNIELEKKQFQGEIIQLQKKLEGAEIHKENLEKTLKACMAQQGQLSEEDFKMTKQLTVIDDMERNLEGYSRGVRSVLEASARGQLSGIKGLVGEVIDVPVGLETAIETALGRKLENIIVKNSDSARDAIQYLKQLQRGRVTFLPLDILLSTPLPAEVKDILSSIDGVVGIAVELINYRQDYHKALAYLLGRVVLVRDMDTGIKVFKTIKYPLQIVTLEGEIINVSGAMTGGSREKRRETPLQRKKEKKKLQEQQVLVRHKLELNRQERQELSLQLDKVQEQVDSWKKDLVEKEFRFEVIEQQAGQTLEEIKECRKEWKNSMDQLAGLDESQEQLMLEWEAAKRDRDAVHGSSELESEQLEELKEKIDIEKREYEVHKERRYSYLEQMEIKQRELQNIENNIEQFRQVENSYGQSLLEAGELQEQMSRLLLNENDRIKMIQEKIQREKQNLGSMQEKILKGQEEEKECRDRISKMRQEILPRKQALMQMENSSRNLEISIARLETEFKSLIGKWAEEFPSPLSELPAQQFSPSDIRNFRQQVVLLARQLEAIGVVDLDSPREFEAINERFSFINQQYEDLLKARDSLQQLLQETEKLMSGEFEEFMLMANESFAQTFQDMFGGGEAVLKLETGKERLESGLDIEVKLPGKKNQALNLLSGGERALTCIAFIFALLRLKPAPFCILDEIDASLDDTNLLRFTGYVKKMAQSMQYIIITHRQSMIESGENIFGVTMPEKGVSRVLTLSLSEMEGLAG